MPGNLESRKIAGFAHENLAAPGPNTHGSQSGQQVGPQIHGVSSFKHSHGHDPQVRRNKHPQVIDIDTIPTWWLIPLTK